MKSGFRSVQQVEITVSLPFRKNTMPVSEETGGGPLNLDEAMALHVIKVLKLTKGKVHGPGGAAELLGINPNTLRGRMNKLGIMYGRKGR